MVHSQYHIFRSFLFTVSYALYLCVRINGMSMMVDECIVIVRLYI